MVDGVAVAPGWTRSAPATTGSFLFSQYLCDELHQLHFFGLILVVVETTNMPPHVDVVVVFQAASKRTPLSKEQLRQHAARTERQYTALIATLTRAGLKAVGRRGENQDQLLILVACPPDLLARLVHCERSAVPLLFVEDIRLTSRHSIAHVRAL